LKPLFAPKAATAPRYAPRLSIALLGMLAVALLLSTTSTGAGAGGQARSRSRGVIRRPMPRAAMQPSVAATMPAPVVGIPIQPFTLGIGLSFLGWNGATEVPDGFFHKPPDDQCAVGPGGGASGRLVIVTNNGIKLMAKDGSTIVAATQWDTVNGFFNSISPPANGAGTDPKVIFDAQSQRFFIVFQDGNSPTNSNLYIAASRTATPNDLTTDWNKFKASAITTINGTATWADYPGLGADATRVVGTWNLFDGTGTYQGTKIRVWNKADLIDNVAPSQVFTDLDLPAVDGGGFDHFSLKPAGVQSSTGLTDSGNFYVFQCIGNSNIGYRLIEVSGTPPLSTAVVAGTDVARAYDNGASNPTVLNGGAPQSGGSPNLATLSNRTMAAVYRNGLVTGCCCGLLNAAPQCSIFWVETSTNGGIGVAPPVTRQSGEIDGTDPTADYAYMPALNVNGHGQILVAYSESSASKFVEIRYVDRDFSDALGTMQSAVLAVASTVHYQDFGNTVPERWGDYGAVAIDPDNDSFWISHEFARATGNGGWGAQIINTLAPTAVDLSSAHAIAYAGGVELRWRTGFEADNVGFHVWCETAGQRTRLTPSPVAGSAMLQSSMALPSGHSYRWWAPGPQAGAYWLEAIDLHGVSRWFGPYSPLASGSPAPAAARSLTLEKLSPANAASHPMPRAAPAPGPPPLGSPAMLAATQFAGRPAVKIAVREEGWYRLTQPELVAAGLDRNASSRTFQLLAEGAEQAIEIRGADGGRFGPNACLEFYGLGLDTPSTDTRIYWLVWGHAFGRRIPALNAERRTPNAPPSFLFTTEARERTNYISAIHNGDAESFFGPLISTEPAAVTLSVDHLDAAPPGPALLEVRVQGLSAIPQPMPDHHATVQLNSAVVGQIIFSGQGQGVLRVPLPPGLLNEGTNTLTLASGDPTDFSLVDTVRLTYWHTYVADGGRLRFAAPAGRTVALSGISGSARVVDVTNPASPIEVSTAALAAAPGAGIRVTVPGPLGQQRLLLAFREDQVRHPPASVNTPSHWWSGGPGGRGADFVIISYRDFLASVAPLKARREKQGLATAVADLEDLYDEFNYGEADPAALRNFIRWSSARWRKSPRFALLVGDATFDPRNYLGLENGNFVPTKFVDTRWMKTASDDWFADFNGDGLPGIAVGRIPVRTAADADAVVAKILRYDQAPVPQPAAVLVASENNGFLFNGENAAVAATLPSSVRSFALQTGPADAAAVRQQVLAAMQAGPALVNYAGHGAVDIWARQIFTVDDARALQNGDRLSIATLMTCLNGYFQDVRGESLAEALIGNPNGGAAAVWASSALTDPMGQAAIDQAFYALLFGGRPRLARAMTLGEAAARAKAATSDLDVRRSWILFGDPTTRIPWSALR
jgi:hypothetical protein